MRLGPLQFLSFILALCLPISVNSQPLTAEERERVENTLSEYQLENDPGFAFGIVRNGEVVFETYAGLAEIAHNTPIGPRTRLNIASNAKQFVGLMVAELASNGRIQMDVDFRTYLPDALPGVQSKITVAQMVNHTSGIRDIYDLWALTGVTWYERALDNDDVLELLNRQTELNFRPGSAYLYSNSNYILLTEVISAVSDQRFDQYARGFFDRLGMPDTGWKSRYGDVLPQEAKAYNNWEGWLENPSIVNVFGDGFLYTSLRDQLEWEKQLQGTDTRLPTQVIAQSQKPVVLGAPGNYGYGLEAGSFLKEQSIFHAGSTGGFNAYFLRLPELNTAFVVMSNSSQISASGIVQATAAALLDQPISAIGDYPAGPDEVLARPDDADILGRYEHSSGFIITIAQTPNGLVREIEGRDPVSLIHETGNIFAYQTIPDLKIVFDKDEAGEARFRLFLPRQPVATATRLAAIPQDAEAKRSLNGCFVNTETDTSVVIQWVEDTTFELSENGRTHKAEMIAEDYLRWNGYRLRFERDGANAVSLMRADNNRIRRVRFDLSPPQACTG